MEVTLRDMLELPAGGEREREREILKAQPCDELCV